MIEDDYQASGDVKKDYMAYSELCDRTPRMEIIDNIHHVLIKSLPNYDDYYIDEDTYRVESKRVPIDDFNELDADEIEKIQTELHIRNPPLRLNFIDTVALSKAITNVTLNFVSLKLVNCGLSRKTLIVLGKALSHRKTLRYLSIEMNPFFDDYEERDEIQSYYFKVKNMESGLFFWTPSMEQAKKRKEEELQHLQLQITIDRKQRGKKKNDQQVNEQENNQKIIENHIISETYLISSFGPLFISPAKHISLRGCDLNDEDAESIARILSENNEIISLNLWGNNITDKGGIAIAQALRTNRSIRSISLAMNKISDRTVQEICDVLRKSQVYTEEEFFSMREKVFKSSFGTMNIPRDPKSLQILLPALPIHLCPYAERKKAEKSKKVPPKSSGGNGIGDGPIEWERLVQRLDEEAPPKKGAKGNSRPNTGKKITPEATVEEPKPLFNIPGNEVIRSINLSCNVMISDKGAELFLNLPYLSLERLNLSYCTVSNTMFHRISQKINETS